MPINILWNTSHLGSSQETKYNNRGENANLPKKNKNGKKETREIDPL